MKNTICGQRFDKLSSILGEHFPCASTTGAHNTDTQEFAATQQYTPRGIHTGATGLICPGRKAYFNLAIRTAIIDKIRATASYGAGGEIA